MRLVKNKIDNPARSTIAQKIGMSVQLCLQILIPFACLLGESTTKLGYLALKTTHQNIMLLLLPFTMAR